MTARETLKQANELELYSVASTLGPLGINADDAPETPVSYDRAAADEEANAEIQTFTASSQDKYKLSALCRDIHEAARFRRDYNIAKASHKQLMLSSYRIMYQRMLKLTAAREKFDAV